MSSKHPVVAITGSSGAGTTSVRRTFEQIFRREGLDAAYIAVMVVGCVVIGVLAIALERRILASANGVSEPAEVPQAPPS